MEEAIQNALVYVIGGVPIAVNVVLTVQALKVFNYVGPENRVTTQQAAILSGLFFGLSGFVITIWPDTAQYIVPLNVMVVGSLSAGLLYEYILKTVGGSIWAGIRTALNNDN